MQYFNKPVLSKQIIIRKPIKKMLKQEIKGHTQLNKKVYIIIKLIPTTGICLITLKLSLFTTSGLMKLRW